MSVSTRKVAGYQGPVKKWKLEEELLLARGS